MLALVWLFLIPGGGARKGGSHPAIILLTFLTSALRTLEKHHTANAAMWAIRLAKFWKTPPSGEQLKAVYNRSGTPVWDLSATVTGEKCLLTKPEQVTEKVMTPSGYSAFGIIHLLAAAMASPRLELWAGRDTAKAFPSLGRSNLPNCTAAALRQWGKWKMNQSGSDSDFHQSATEIHFPGFDLTRLD